MATQDEPKKRRPTTEQERKDRKNQVLKAKRPSGVRSIADAVVIKSRNLFFLAEPNGSVSCHNGHGFGLYYHDCRFLNGYELRVDGHEPDVLASVSNDGYRAVFQLTNPQISRHDQTVAKEDLGLRWERIIDPEACALRDRIALTNYGPHPYRIELSLKFEASFDDVYEVRGLLPEHYGTLLEPEWSERALHLRYQGADGLFRSTTVQFSEPPHLRDKTEASFRIELAAGESHELKVSLLVQESQAREEPPLRPADDKEVAGQLARASQQWYRRHANVRSDSLLLDRVLDRSFRDLHMLRSFLDRSEYFAAGLPWFATLFGRDSLITSLQKLSYDRTIAAQTLRLLASKQGTRVDSWRDEQPGKILHELRVGEMARMGEIPYTPYYGTIDATLLFLIVLAEHAAWCGTLDLFCELRPHVERALEWIDRYGDQDGDGYVEYHSSTECGLVNQGWKDSGDAIVNADGSLADPPIALVEVQGYVYKAKTLIADLFRRAGEELRADRLDREARELRERFNHDFWCEELGTFALARQRGDRLVEVVSSNPGQALWTGIVEPDKARRVIHRLMQDDMFSGWGVRTLSMHTRRYNPIGYHLGTVWPHDNSLIAAGMRRYGDDHAAYRIFNGIFEAGSHFPEYRMPELFCGFPRAPFQEPIRYPVACHPQAWAAGSLPYLIQTMLGLEGRAFDRQLRVVRPLLPHFVEYLELHHISVGEAECDLRFERRGQGIHVEVLRVSGPLEVVVEGQGAEQAP